MTSDHPIYDAVVAAALERLATENANHARAARAAGEKDDAKFFQRAANAYSKALQYWYEGVRPELTPAGNWLLPSQRGTTEPAHLLHKAGDWECSCVAGNSFHWAKALVIAFEVAEEVDNRPALVLDADEKRRAYKEACEALLECY